MPFWSTSDQTLAHNVPKLSETIAMPALKTKTTIASHRPFPDAVDESLPFPAQTPTRRSVVFRRRNRIWRARFWTTCWAGFKRRLASPAVPTSSSHTEEAMPERPCIAAGSSTQGDSLGEEVDEIVVDKTWAEGFKNSASRSVTNSDHHARPEMLGEMQQGANTSVQESDGYEHGGTGLTLHGFIRRKLLPVFREAFSTKFENEKLERNYIQEYWSIKKTLAIWAGLWLILNWILGIIFARPIYQLYDKIFYYGVAPALSLSILPLVVYDWPRDRSTMYQTILAMSVWSWPFYQITFMYFCGFYPNSPHVYLSCQGRDLLITFYYSAALQAIGLFGLKMNRLPAAIGATLYFVIACSLMIPLKRSWVRGVVNILLFHSFLIYVHYKRESSERRLFILRDELKMQFKATQKAQVNERMAADSKRRLTSYVFHEVRVPLNTALLAVQNMQASGTITKDQGDEFSALQGSLGMMSKVLNDVLDFNRMDSGNFESVNLPYGFHQVMKSLFSPLRLDTDARGLKFTSDLDPRIDEIARRASYEALGQSAEAIDRHIAEYPDVEGIVIGDESRLRQIVTNLASNACKFTPKGGKLSIKTQLILPTAPIIDPSKDNSHVNIGSCPLPVTAVHLSCHDTENFPLPLEFIVVRIEVTDTGVGIKAGEQTKLFSAFTQTEQGRQQGGKGTGLGLALVRQIVKLSNGRLGVHSKLGEGSTFWVELPLGVGQKTVQYLSHPLPPGFHCHTSDGSVGLKQSRYHQTQPMVVDHSVPSDFTGGDSVDPDSSHREFMFAVSPVLLSRRSSDSLSSQPKAFIPKLPLLNNSDRPVLNGATPTQTRRRRQPPSHVPIPTPPLFFKDPNATSNSDASQRSSEHTPESPLTHFDLSFSRVSPSASTQALHIEPGLPVLVVDDDVLTRKLMTRVLTRLGCHVSTAENGEVALEMILGRKQVLTPSTDSSGRQPILDDQEKQSFYPEGKYAVIFLDNQMPVMSGLRAVQKLRGLGRKDLIVGITGNALLTDQKEYLDAGADRVLTKPVLERSLRDILLLADNERRKTVTQGEIVCAR